MNEVEYVVPPQSGAPKVSNNPTKPPKKPSKFLAWIGANKAASVAGLVMAIIVVLAGTAMVTGQKVSIFGLQLNPLYQQANCPVDLTTGMEETSCGGFWNQPTTNVDKISISGTFSEGKPGSVYSKELSVSSSAKLPCDWTLDSVNPPISGAAIKPVVSAGAAATSDIDLAKAIFTATPSTEGKYQVNVKVTCQGGQTATKSFAWVVGSTTSNALSISGSMPETFVGQQYSANLQTVNAKGANCTFELTEVKPKLEGATLVKVDSLVATEETSAMFNAKPTESGIYAIKVSVSCATTGSDARLSAQKDFSLTVKPTKQPPIPAALDISANFGDTKVGEAHSFEIKTVNADGEPCSWYLDKVTPSITGAKLSAPDNLPTDRESHTMFTATPQTAATYKVSISVGCGPSNGTKVTAKKDFTWKVTGSTTGGGGSGGGGSTASNCSSNKDKLMPIYRFWKAADGDHFFTTNANERPGDYVYEGIAGYVYKEKVAGSTAVYRSYHSGLKAHYYSTTDDATNYGYANEGVLGYAFSNNTTGALPWFRLHKGYPQSDYLETTHTGEKAAAIGMGYMDEGIVVNICEKNT